MGYSSRKPARAMRGEVGWRAGRTRRTKEDEVENSAIVSSRSWRGSGISWSWCECGSVLSIVTIAERETFVQGEEKDRRRRGEEVADRSCEAGERRG